MREKRIENKRIKIVSMIYKKEDRNMRENEKGVKNVEKKSKKKSKNEKSKKKIIKKE